MDTGTILGLAAGILSTASFLPQVVKTWKTRSARDLSYAMLILFLSGITLWFFYGLQLRSLPIILANGVTIVLLILLLTMKILYSREIDHL
ncbi:MAG: SemiSWEET transporter [Methanomicrobiales archaeon]|nr:SemiSWEET transporter [Methanomicrobiales archaeon]